MTSYRVMAKRRLEAVLDKGAGDLLGGLSSSVLAIAYCFSFASLIFAPSLSPWLANGVVATFLTMAISAAVMSARSSLPFVIAGPDGATSAVMAALVAALLQRLRDAGAPDDLLAPVMIVVALTTAIAGGFLYLLGHFRAGSVVRYVPYPVIGGFLASTGFLMIEGSIRVVTDHRLTVAHFETIAEPLLLAKLAASLALAGAITLALRRSRNPYVVPGIVVVAILVTHLCLHLSDVSLAEAQGAGWMFSSPAPVAMGLPWDLSDLAIFPWHVLPGLAGDLLAVVFVTSITMLLNTNGIEFVVRREADVQRELKAIGVANAISAACGGYVSCTSLSRTTMNYAAGARGRLGGAVMCILSIGALVAGPSFVAMVPKFVLGGLLLFLGGGLVHRWLVGSARQLSRLDYLSLILVTLLILQWGFVAGILIGVTIGCITFALSASRIEAIKFTFDGSEYRSSLDRGAEQLAILGQHSREIQGIVLHSYLFFGSANRLYQFVKSLLERRSECRFLVFDFRLVTGIDSSAMHSFAQIRQLVTEKGTRLVVVGLSPSLQRGFEALLLPDDIIADDLDHALEQCENAVIAVHAGRDDERHDLVEWLSGALGSANYARELARSCERLEVREGEVVAGQGEPADCMHFILRGRMAIIVGMEAGSSARVRSLGPCTTIGEMGLITGGARSATIKAEADSVLYVFPRSEFERLSRDNHALIKALLTYVIVVMTERLRFASNLIGVLRR